MANLCEIDGPSNLAEKLSQRAQALLETLPARDVSEQVNRRPESMPHIAYLRFWFLRRQFQGVNTVVIPAAITTGRTLVKRWKALRGDDR